VEVYLRIRADFHSGQYDIKLPRNKAGGKQQSGHSVHECASHIAK